MRLCQKIAWLFIILMFFTTDSVQAESVEESDASVETIAEDQLEQLGMNDLSVYWDHLLKTYGQYLPEMERKPLTDLFKEGQVFSIESWAKGLLSFLFHELFANGKLLGTLILLTVFSVFLQILQNAFEQGTVSKTAYGVVLMVLLILALNSFRLAMNYAMEAVDQMVQFLLALMPILLALLASTGGAVSATVFHPFLIFLMNISGLVIQKVVLPLLFFSTLLSVVSLFSAHYKATKLADLLRRWSVGLLSVFMAVYLAIVSIQGTAAAVADGLAIRTAKFFAGNFIPVVGKMFTEAADTVMSASLLLKNTIGIAGAGILLLIVAFPAFKILALVLVYKVASAILQPLGDETITDCLEIIGKNMTYVFAALVIVSFMFLLSIVILVAASNVTMMIR
ncbi:stage III sporulation protein AE [Bacillus aerolatus]|uniref:Stage III sporulation protein AE n=1 Tax=Bacillus aerolatus TaxID=2653354 RepID=A0A6I1FKG5_9BACI|nr:stage III sporulation protein AE [Bacillus aerolatus]KAB7709219.1 stage III sporulation protein AE [Bacillus aerolatus]